MKKIIFFFVMLLALSSLVFAVTGQVSSFYGQSNPFNISIPLGQNQTYYLSVPKYSYVNNLTYKQKILSSSINYYNNGTITFQDGATIFEKTLNNSKPYNEESLVGQGYTASTPPPIYVNNFSLAGNFSIMFKELGSLNLYMGLKNYDGYIAISQYINTTSGGGDVQLKIVNGSNPITETTREFDLGYRQAFDADNYAYYADGGYHLCDDTISVQRNKWIEIKWKLNSSAHTAEGYINNTLCHTLTNWNGVDQIFIGVGSSSYILFYDKFYINQNNLFTDSYLETNISNATSANNILSSGCLCNDCIINGNNCQIPYAIYNDTVMLNLTNATYSYGLDNCSNSFGISSNATALNYSVKNEISNSFVSADVTGTFNYSIDGINYNQYSVELFGNNFSMCIYPNWASVLTNDVLYASAVDYPQRRFYQSWTLTNSTQLSNLFLLNTSLGIYGRFKTVDSFSNPIVGVNVKMYQSTDLFTIIEEENTDGSGIATFWVNPNQDYYFVFTKSGYSIFTTTLRVTSTEIYTIFMSSPSTSFNDYSYGVQYYFTPASGRLQTNQEYNFTFNLSSTYWDITNCNFYISLNNETILKSSNQSFNSRKCGINISYSPSGYGYYKTYATVEYNNTVNITYHPFYGETNYTYSNYTLMAVVSDIDNLVNSNEAGLDWRTRMLIAFIICVAVTASFCVKFNTILYNPEWAMVIFTVLVLLFSYIGWFEVNNLDSTAWNTFTWAFPNVVGFIKQYLVFLSCFLLTGGFMIWRQYG